MSNIVLFRQARVNGGVHMGLEVDGAGWDYYDSGSDDHDPALLWYVDLRAEGQNLPDSPEGAASMAAGPCAACDRNLSAVGRATGSRHGPGRVAVASGKYRGTRWSQSRCRLLLHAAHFRAADERDGAGDWPTLEGILGSIAANAAPIGRRHAETGSRYRSSCGALEEETQSVSAPAAHNSKRPGVGARACRDAPSKGNCHARLHRVSRWNARFFRAALRGGILGPV